MGISLIPRNERFYRFAQPLFKYWTALSLSNRYKSIFKSDNNLVISSALFFSITHILFLNFIAPILSFIGGLLFANTYNKHRSLLLVSIEHGLYGNTLFFIGLGWYFWGGSLNY